MKNELLKNTGNLYEAILQLKTVEECKAFFEDLCTIHELRDISQRYEVVRLLDQGVVYQEIARLTGSSTATICRVNQALVYGSSGYRTVLDRMKQKDERK